MFSNFTGKNSYFYLFIYLFWEEGFFSDLFRGLPRDTKMTTDNGLKVA